MIVAGIGWISKQKCGFFRQNQQKEFQDFKSLYQEFENEGVFKPSEKKVRWLNTNSNRHCFAAMLALRDAVKNVSDIHGLSSEISLLSASEEGSLKANLEYFQDYIQSGRKLARGILFTHTLPTSLTAETAIAFGFKGPVLHLSAAKPKLNLIFERSESLSKRAKNLSFLCFAATEELLLCFFLRPAHSKGEKGFCSLSELKSQVGHLWNLKEVFKILKTPVTVDYL